MKVGIPYDLKKIFIEIPDRVQTEIIYPNEVTKMKSGPLNQFRLMSSSAMAMSCCLLSMMRPGLHPLQKYWIF
jgi:hypothetical protein